MNTNKEKGFDSYFPLMVALCIVFAFFLSATLLIEFKESRQDDVATISISLYLGEVSDSYYYSIAQTLSDDGLSEEEGRQLRNKFVDYYQDEQISYKEYIAWRNFHSELLLNKTKPASFRYSKEYISQTIRCLEIDYCNQTRGHFKKPIFENDVPSPSK